MVGAWTKSVHNVWVRRLRRTSTLPELLQVELFLFSSYLCTHKCFKPKYSTVPVSFLNFYRFLVILLVLSIMDGHTKVTQLLGLTMIWMISLQALHLCPKHHLRLHCGW